MKFKTYVAGSNDPRGVRIDAGESVEMAIQWRNANGSARDMTDATVSVRVRDSSGAEVSDANASYSNGVVLIPAASTETWRGTYRVDVIEERPTDVPASKGLGSFYVTVE